MTTFSFLGSRVSYEPTRLTTSVASSQNVKYRGSVYSSHQAIASTTSGKKGLTHRGIAY